MSAARNLPRSPLTGAERMAEKLRDNSTNRFCPSFARDPYGINTESRQDADKTQAIKRASI